MKKYLFTILAFVCGLTMTGRDRLYVQDFSISAGQTKTVSLILENDTTYCALQTDIYMPAGLVINTEDGEYIIDLTGRCSNRHVVSSYQQPNGAIRVLIASQSSTAFTGKTGAIATVSVTATSSYKGGELSLRNSVAVEVNGTKHQLEDYPHSEGLRGDVDGSGIVDVEDVNAAINIILKFNTMSDYPGSADLDGNGIIDVEDVNAMINIILKL